MVYVEVWREGSRLDGLLSEGATYQGPFCIWHKSYGVTVSAVW